MSFFVSKRAFKGQQLSEYTVVIVLVAVAVIAGLLAMNTGIRDTFEGSLSKAGSPSASKAILANTQKSSVGVSQDPVTTSAMLILTDGTSVSYMDSLSSSVSSMVETSGANGATESMALQMDSIINTLKTQGKISDKQYQSLVALSNQGHYMAKLEGMIAAAAVDASSFYGSVPITLDGITYPNVEAVANSLGVDPKGQPGSGNGAQLQKFQTLYSKALDDGSLSDPSVKTVIENLVSRIATIGESVETITDSENASNQSVNSFNLMAAQSISNKAAVKICNTGNGSDSGTFCQ